MKRRAVQRFALGGFGDPTEVHHDDPLACVADDREVVTDQQVRQTEPLLEVDEQAQDLRLDRHVQRRHRLVENDQLRVDGEGARDRDPLPLAARELVRIPGHVFAPETDEVHQLCNARGPFIRSADAVDGKPFTDQPADGHPGIERHVRVLEDDLEPPPQRSELLRRQAGDIDTVDENLARRRLVEPGDGATECRLAAATLADEPERLALLDRQRDAIDCVDDLVASRQAGRTLDREVDLEVADVDDRRARA